MRHTNKEQLEKEIMFNTIYSVDAISEVKTQAVENLNMAHHYFPIVT